MSSTLERRPAIDGRIAARRRTVREAGARRRLRWLLVLFGLAGGGALVAWLLFQSSLLSVSAISISGEDRSDVAAIADDLGIEIGMPTFNVPADALEARLVADPWIAAADVSVRWPGTVEVTVIEHVPAAWLRAGETWLLAAAGGAVLETAPSIPEDAPRIDVGSPPAAPGETIGALEAVAAIEFLSRLPAQLAVGASVSGDGDGLYAVVAGFDVELGYPSDMADKAAALTAMLDGDAVRAGSTISVVSPLRPAVREPRRGRTQGAAGATGETAADGDGGDGD